MVQMVALATQQTGRGDGAGDRCGQSFIDAHAGVLVSSFDEVAMSERMRERLQHSDWVFSGTKALSRKEPKSPSPRFQCPMIPMPG